MKRMISLLSVGKCFPRRMTVRCRETVFCFCLALCFLSVLFLPYPAGAADQPSKELKRFLDALEKQNMRHGWKDIQCSGIPWEYHRRTGNHHPLIFARFGNPAGDCVLFLGGVHGDELPTVYLMFKLAHYIQDHPQVIKDTCIVIAPLVNPDGYLNPLPTRVNATGVDINRNFPTRRWHPDAHRQWLTKGRKNRRYYPGPSAGSEQETLFQVALIKRFKPQKILSAHSPLNFFDYDGPSSDLNSFEQWMEKISREANHPLKKFGCFPGSLGNYAGHERNIFTVTLELPTSDPKKGPEYFHKFQPAFLKFINLPVAGTPPYTRLVKSGKS
ncbi:MAG: succinylglutamate desuccinylase/aspartoacylase family protein [Deltaproteobacteria bacterium]